MIPIVLFWLLLFGIDGYIDNTYKPVHTDPITGGIRMAPVADPQPAFTKPNRLSLDGESNDR